MTVEFYNLMYMIIHLFDIVIITKLFDIFFENKPESKIKSVLSYCLYYFGTGLVYIIFNIALLTMCVNIVTLFVIALNYKSTLKRKILCVVFSYIIFFAADIFICAITGYYNKDILVKGSYNNIFGQALIKVFTYLIAVVTSYLKNIKKDVLVRKSSWFVTFFVPVSTMYMEFNFITSDNVSKVHACLSIMIVLALNYVCLYMYDSLSSMYRIKMNEALLEQEKNYYLNQCELMRESTEQVKSFRHDMKNQFFMLKEMCDNKMYEDLGAQLSKYAETIDVQKYYSQSENTIVDSIINYKLKNADIDGISVETTVSVPSKVKVEISDLVTILGNLLDNALTALSSVSNDKKLYLKIIYDRGRIIICVRNTYSTPVKYVNGNIITTKTDRNNHGHGLSNVRKSVEKYEGYMEIDHSDGIFSVDIIMFVPS